MNRIFRVVNTILLALVFGVSFAQEFDRDTYMWQDQVPQIQLTEEEKKLSSLVVSSKKFVEYRMGKVTGLTKYVVSHNIEVLNDDRAVEAGNKIYVPINYYSYLENIKTRVILNGKVVAQHDIKDAKKIQEKEVQYYLLAIEGVSKGAIVETITYMKVSASLYSHDIMQETEPVKLAQFTLVSPKNLIFKTKAYNTDGKLTDTTIGDKRQIGYILKDLPAYEDEKYSLGNANKVRVEYAFEKNTDNLLSRGDRWETMGVAYYERMFRLFDKNAKDIDKLILKKLPLKGKTNEEKAFIIEHHLKTNINLVQEANDEELMAVCLKNKYASLFNLTQLHILCLQKAGVPFEVAISCEKDHKRFDPDFDSWSFLEYVVIYLPESKNYITPANLYLRCGYLPSDFLGQNALFIKGDAGQPSRTPSISVRNIGINEVAKSKDVHELRLSMNEDLSTATIVYSKEMGEYTGMGIKSFYYMADEKQKQEMVENIIKNDEKEIKLSNIKVENTDISHFKQYSAPLKVTATLQTDVFLENAGDKVLLKLGELIGPQEQIYQEKKRQNPIDIPYSHQYMRDIRVKIPQGRKLEGLDKINIHHEYVDKDGPLFGFDSSYKMDGDELVVTCREHYDRISFPIEKFDDFRKVINAAADFNKITILVK
jgi:hypothetical protein